MKTSDYEKLSSPSRTRTSVAISGLDRSTPDDMVKDGACEELHNLRYKDNAWRPVSDFSTKVPIGMETASEFTFVYHHPAAGENVYIARYKDEPETYVSVTLNDIDVHPEIKIIGTYRGVKRITHFGNILIFYSATEEWYLFFQDGKYTKFTLPESPTLRSFTKTFFPMQPKKFTQGNGWKDYKTGVSVDPNVSMKAVWPICNMTSGEPLIPTFPDANHPEAANAWHGEIAFFVAYRMVDGTIISPSMLNIIASEQNIPNVTRNLTTGSYGYDEGLCIGIEHSDSGKSDTNAWVEGSMQYVKGEVSYNLPDINTDIIKEVVCFATRIHSIFDYSKHINNQNYSFISVCYANNDLPTQPFYLMQSKEILSSLVVFSITADNLANVENNMLYEPNARGSSIVGNTFDYNNRLHLYDTVSSIPSCSDVHDIISPASSSDLQDYTSAVKVVIDNTTYTAARKDTINSIPASRLPSPLILSYHDYRAKQYIINKETDKTDIFSLQPAIANNIAYYIPQPAANLKYPGITFAFNDPTPSLIDNRTFYQPNRLQVSSANNPFSLPFENSYSIGSASNRIIALQSAAIEMSDAKFGEFPLFAFTEEGIFALQAGSGTLYASIIPINYDKIINPNTLAINGGIIYITERGVHLLSARGDKLTSEASTLISSPIHGKDGRPPLDFLRTCQIMWPKEHNEVIFHNPDNGEEIAYVFNLDAGYWSTRSLKGTKINTDEMVDSNTIYDLTHEDVSKTLAGAISTRPIKLGNVEFKRADTIIPRLNTGNTSSILAFYALGSVDGSKFHPLRKCTLQLEPNKVNPIVIRRTPFSAKYFKFIFGLDHSRGVPYSTAITHIDMEWYTKFQRRMR